MNAITLCILGYVALQLFVGAWVSRRVKTEDDYMVAGRRLGYTLCIFTTFATWFGAETCIGAAGAIYERGLGAGSADPFGYALCLLFMGLVFAVPLWRRRLTTVADAFRQRFSPGVERFVVLLMVPTSLLWASAQVRAFGQVLSSSSGLDHEITISIAAGVVIVYTMSGGLLADAWTDLVQGVALAVGLAVLLVGVWVQGGSELAARIRPEQLQLFGGEATLLDHIETWSIPICGSVLAGELVSRVLAARSPQVAQRSTLVAAGLYLAFGLIPVFVGLVGAQVVPDLAHPEQILPAVAQRFLPTLWYAVFAGALVSAILSTVDSSLLVAASLVSHNLVSPLRPSLSDRGRVRLARAGVAVFGILSYFLALHAEGVLALVEAASAFGSAGIFVSLLLGLFTPLGSAGAAHAALAGGAGAWIAGAYVLDLEHPYLTSLGVALVGYLVVAWLVAVRARGR